MTNMYVDSEELKQISQSIKTKANNILEIYQNETNKAILSANETIQMDSIDIEQIINALNKIFTNLSTKINSLADFLTTTVANQYDEIYTSIRNEFDTNFANEMVKILGTTLSTGTITEKLINNNLKENPIELIEPETNETIEIFEIQEDEVLEIPI